MGKSTNRSNYFILFNLNCDSRKLNRTFCLLSIICYYGLFLVKHQYLLYYKTKFFIIPTFIFVACKIEFIKTALKTLTPASV